MKCNRTGCNQQARFSMCVELTIGQFGQEYDLYFCGDHKLDMRRMRALSDGGLREWNGSGLIAIDRHPEIPF